MTRYAYEPGRPSLVASWGTGRGDLAEVVSALAPGVTRDDALRLASALTDLSGFLWRAYTRPAGAAGDPAEPNNRAWQRAEERARFSVVLSAIRRPELPTESGLLSVSYSPIEESAHRVGRALHAIGDAELAERVTAEVQCELDAIESAELGDLTGRAQQAVLLSRADASPVQVQAADAALRARPLGAVELFTDLDPTAAAVAAAHWLQAAADVVGPMAGIDPVQVVIEADNLEALQVETPTLVLRRLNDGARPHQVVVGLVAEAMEAADGHLADPDALTWRLAELHERASNYGQQADAVRAALLAEFRITPLDPARPAPDLLEDLLDGIRGCWLLYANCADGTSDDDPVLAADGQDRARSSDSPEDEDEEAAAAERDRIDAEFADEVRAEADANRDRLI